jgi:hypothetical protein
MEEVALSKFYENTRYLEQSSKAPPRAFHRILHLNHAPSPLGCSV